MGQKGGKGVCFTCWEKNRMCENHNVAHEVEAMIPEGPAVEDLSVGPERFG